MKSIFVIALAALATFAAADSNDIDFNADEATKQAWSDWSFQHYGQSPSHQRGFGLLLSGLGGKLAGDASSLVIGQAAQIGQCMLILKKPKNECLDDLKNGLLAGSLAMAGNIGKRDTFDTIKSKLFDEAKEFGACIVGGNSFQKCFDGLKDIIPGRAKRGLFDLGNMGDQLLINSANLAFSQAAQVAQCKLLLKKSTQECLNDLKNGLLAGSLGLVGSIGKRDTSTFDAIKSKLVQEVKDFGSCINDGKPLSECFSGLKDLIPGRNKRAVDFNNVLGGLLQSVDQKALADLAISQATQVAQCKLVSKKSIQECLEEFKNGVLQGGLKLVGIGKRDILATIKTKLNQEISEFGQCLEAKKPLSECFAGLKDIIPGRNKRAVDLDNLLGGILKNVDQKALTDLVTKQAVQTGKCVLGGKSVKECAEAAKNDLLQNGLALLG